MRHNSFFIVGALLMLLVCGIAFAESPYSDQISAGIADAEDLLMQEYGYRVAAKTAAENFNEANDRLLQLNDDIFYAKKFGRDVEVIELMAELKAVMAEVTAYESEFNKQEDLADKAEENFMALLDDGNDFAEMADEQSQAIIDGYDEVLTAVESKYLEVTAGEAAAVEVEEAVEEVAPATVVEEVVTEEKAESAPEVEKPAEEVASEPAVEPVVAPAAESSLDYSLDKTEEVLAVVPEEYKEYDLVVKVYSDSFELGYIVLEPKYVVLAKGNGKVVVNGENTGTANLKFTEYDAESVQFIADYLGVNLPGEEVSLRGAMLTNGNVEVFVLKKKLTFLPE